MGLMNPKSARRTLARLVIAAAVAIALYALNLGGDGPAPAAPAAADEIRRFAVIDGDTVRDVARSVTYRVVNIDTPEVGDGAACAAERRHGVRATQRTRALLAAAQEIVARPVGRIDSYGRVVAAISVDGRDLGEALIAEGLARRWRGRREPWCDRRGRLLPPAASR